MQLGTSDPQEFHSAALPSPWVVSHAMQMTQGARVVDIACGNGRHARWLAAQGFILAIAMKFKAWSTCSTNWFEPSIRKLK